MTSITYKNKKSGKVVKAVITGDQVDITPVVGGETTTIKLGTLKKNYEEFVQPEERQVEVEVEATEYKRVVESAKKSGKPIDPTSGRQAILQVLFERQEPMTPGEIRDVLQQRGREVKYISSHLNYFKSHGQIIHLPGTTSYKLSSKTQQKMEAVQQPALV